MTTTKKTPCWLTILILTGLGISVSPHQVLTRTDKVSRALSPVLSSYEVIRMAPGEMERQVRTTGELRFRFKESDFYFNLEPHNMRSPNYQAVETGPGGVRRTLPPRPVNTFKGTLAGQKDTQGRFTLTDSGVEGVVYAPEGRYYVEPLRYYLPEAPAGELVVYSHADIKPGEEFKCGVSLPQRLQRGMDRVEAQVTARRPTNYVFEVATDADFEYVKSLGGSVNAINEIESILNQVEGIYQSELLLQLRISFQHAWATEEDPYAAWNSSGLLDEFTDYWNTHFAAEKVYDLAHLWTDRSFTNDPAAGRANMSVVCRNRSKSYGLSTWNPYPPLKYLYSAHEIGHNFGASHTDEQNPPIADCFWSIMLSSGWFADLTFCQFSREEIAAYVSRNNGCLTTQPVTLQPPTDLTATVASKSRINLSWQDSSTNETGFIVQRRDEYHYSWVELGRTAANSTTFSDSDDAFLAATIYQYRVQAINATGPSVFSNVAAARTPSGLAPTVSHFSPRRGSAHTPVTITGTNLLSTVFHQVSFNGKPTASFMKLSDRQIQALVPAEATTGPISVETKSGTAVSTNHFTVTKSGSSTSLFVPIVLRSRGQIKGSFFTSEVTLTNRGSSTAAIEYTYTASIGTGTGTATDSLRAGRQRVIPDAISYLTSRGVPIGEGTAGGTLRVDFSNLSSPSDAAVSVRVSTPVEEGRAGLAFPGLPREGLLTGPAFITGLRQNSMDRSNVALQNAGDANEGSIALRVTVFSGDPASAVRGIVLPELLTLDPGGFHQYNRILSRAGFDNGYVKVERVSGTAPYYAYGVINDNINSDGSFVFPVREDSLVGKTGQTLPVILETGAFTSELTVTNFSPVPKTVDFRFVAEAIETDDGTAGFSLRLKAGEQRILPQVVDWMRQREVAGIGQADRALVGPLFAVAAKGDMSGIVIGARTGAPDKRGGQYSLFYNAVPYGSTSTLGTWIYGFQQNAENRSNLAIINTGEVDDRNTRLHLDIYDGQTGRNVSGYVKDLEPYERFQFDLSRIMRILNVRHSYVHIWRYYLQKNGNNPFIAYGVINDGRWPGLRSGDGAFLLSQE